MKISAGLALAVTFVIFQMATAQETTTPAVPDITTTPCRYDVDCVPDCERVIGSDGCPTCVCPPTCQDVNCTEDEECVLKQVICITYPCFPVPSCVPRNEKTTTTTPGMTTTRCMIEVLCNFGCERVIGSNGCPTCVCLPTCEGVYCPDDYECEMQVQPCGEVSCAGRPTCVPMRTTMPCPVITCAPGCVEVRGLNGCQTCDCPPTCENVTCAKDEECVLKQIHFCITVPCFPSPICVPINDSCKGTPNTDRCGGFELLWFYNSSANACQLFSYYGCEPSPNTFLSLKACEDKCKSTQPICDCDDDCYTLPRKGRSPKCICPNPCKDFSCTSDEICKLREVNCDEAQKTCNPAPYCAPKLSCPKKPPCAKLCMYGLKTDENGCEPCQCRKEPIPC